MMDEVEVPTFLCKGEEIVEVMFTRWADYGLEGWGIVEDSPQVVVLGDVDRVVFELPTGCFEVELQGAGGGHTIGFRPPIPGASFTPTRCLRPHGHEEIVSSAQLDIEDHYRR